MIYLQYFFTIIKVMLSLTQCQIQRLINFSKQQYKTNSIMANKYNDEFDFDDLDIKPANKKIKDVKKAKKQDDDFFDLDDIAPTKNNKPTNTTYKTKQTEAVSNNKQKNKKISKNSYDDYEEIYEQVQEIKSPKVQLPGKKNDKKKYQQQFQQISIKKPQTSKLNLPALKKVTKEESQEQFYQQLNEIPSPIKNNAKKQPVITKKQQPKEQVYQEQVFDEYGEDFQEVEEQKPANDNKNNLQGNKKKSDNRLAINTNKVFTNKGQSKSKIPPKPNQNVSIPKPIQKENNKVPPQPSKKQIQPQISLQQISNEKKTLNKSSSKHSIHSNDSKKFLVNSRATTKKYTGTQFIANKHILLVQRKFPETEDQISLYNNDKINKMNDQIREMIRKFNEQLNELINKNMILLKDKPSQKLPNVNQKIKVLEQQLKSGSTAIQVVEHQLDRLKGRQGQLRQQQYQLLTQNKIEQCKESIKQIGKIINHLKVSVNSQGNKLSKQQAEKKIAQQLHQIKIMLMQVKKEEQKNEVKLQKLTSMAQELEGKNADRQYELSEQVQTAKEKGIVLHVRQQLKKRQQQLKLKMVTLQNHKKVIQNLNNTKCQNIIHEIDQLKITFRSVENQILKMAQNVQNIQDQTIKEIKKAKQNPKISANLSQNLDKVLKSIEQNQAINFSEVRTEGNHSQASQRPAKTFLNQNKSKQKPLRNNSSKKDPKSNKKVTQAPLNDEINLLKPNFIKKKQKTQQTSKQIDIKNPLYQRIWNEQDEQKKHEQQQKKKQEQQRQRLKKAQQIAEEQKKNQPFNLKKLKRNNNQQKSFQLIPQTDKKQSNHDLKIEVPLTDQKQNKEEQKVSIGPKFMKLNKKNDANKIQLNFQKPVVVQEPKLQLKIQKKQNQQELPFLPKRLNLRNKLQKKEEGYMPTVQKNIEIIKPKPQIKQEKKEYTPNFSFKNEELTKINAYEPKKIQEEPKLQISEEKPKFNLRLRDKARKQTSQNAYIPTTHMTQVQQDKISFKPKVNNDTYNPFNKQQLLQEQKPKFNIPTKDNQEYAPNFKRINVEKEKPVNTNLYSNNLKAFNQQPAPSFNKEASVINNPYAPKPAVNNPYAPPPKEQNIYNPYAPKATNNPAQIQNKKVTNPYAEASQSIRRQGPVKKLKIQNKAPKQKFNIYQQAQDLTQANKILIDEPIIKKQQPVINLAKTNELDLNAMLGIKKKEKASDLDDLLGEVKVNKNNKKKNTDFFNDLEL